jgi:hypothetical protein
MKEEVCTREVSSSLPIELVEGGYAATDCPSRSSSYNLPEKNYTQVLWAVVVLLLNIQILSVLRNSYELFAIGLPSFSAI